jgi:hypothetical protein
MPYLDLTTYRARTIAPPLYLDEVEAQHPGWLLEQLTFWSSWIDSRLKKRYAAPFAAPPNTPPTVLGWLARIVDAELYLKRGYDPNDKQSARVDTRADTARAEIQEAADSEKGLFELPLRADEPAATAITRGGPLGYTEQSPYTWSDVQRDAHLGGDP